MKSASLAVTTILASLSLGAFAEVGDPDDVQQTDAVPVGEPQSSVETRSFLDLNINGDDVIDRDEAIEAEIERDFSTMDFDNSGTVNRSEYEQYQLDLGETTRQRGSSN